MDRQELHDIENRCVQEAWPKCQATCPLHVDVRAFLARMAAGDPAGARKVLERTMSLPDIVGRICDHPCETVCLRRELGGPLAVGALERACLEAVPPADRVFRLPATGRGIAILGGGLDALTLAWELARKGHTATIYAAGEGLGGRLGTLPERVLPRRVLDETLARLAGLGVVARPRQRLDAGLLETVREECDAVYVAYAQDGPLVVPRAAVEPVSLRWRGNIFCGGWPEEDGCHSWIGQVADGRRAALSVQRLLAGADLLAAREKEGACATRSRTNLVAVAPLPRVTPTGEGDRFLPEEARTEAGRCLDCQCLECVKVCVYLQRYKAYPKVYARQIFNNLYTVQVGHPYNRLINSCMLCGLCTELCPGDFPMAEVCLSAREEMVRRGNEALLPHDFALRDMTFANGPDFALLRPEPGRTTCGNLFFPGCQLGGEPDGKIPEAYAFLRANLDSGVGLALGCCGMPAHWGGRSDMFEQTMAALRTGWESLGRPRIIAACASCQAAFALGASDIPVISLWRVLAEETGLPEPSGVMPKDALAVHDPCASRHDPETRVAVRSLLDRLGVTFTELPLSGNLTQCCGYGGLAAEADPGLAAAATALRAGQSPLDYLATCAMCRDRLARTGKRTYHLLDLVFPGGFGDPAARPDPGFSLRHEERARLRRRMLATVWGEIPPREAQMGPELVVSPELREVLEARRILVTDVAAVVAQAEAGGQRFLDRSTGRYLACQRPRRVTYWVEYTMEDGRAVIHTAYSHRMLIKGRSDLA
jgi:Fe-S oxidoreductase